MQFEYDFQIKFLSRASLKSNYFKDVLAFLTDKQLIFQFEFIYWTYFVEDLISQAYCRVLNRCPDWGGFISMLRLYPDNGNIKEIIRVLAKSPEFNAKYIANQPTGQAVENLYDHLLNRQSDASGRAAWLQMIPQQGYQWVIDQFLASYEYVSKFNDNLVPGNGRPGCSCCGYYPGIYFKAAFH